MQIIKKKYKNKKKIFKIIKILKSKQFYTKLDI